MTRAKISEHFIVEEFDCHNGERVPGYALGPLKEWARVWGEPLRKRFGPVTVMSGYRPEAYNRSIGGAKASAHIYSRIINGRYAAAVYGVAADVICARGEPHDWQAWAMANNTKTNLVARAACGGVGRYSTFVHLDTGPRRTWHG